MPEIPEPVRTVTVALWGASNIGDAQVAAQRALDAVPDGWAKLDGKWVQVKRNHPRGRLRFYVRHAPGFDDDGAVSYGDKGQAGPHGRVSDPNPTAWTTQHRVLYEVDPEPRTYAGPKKGATSD